MKGILFDDFAVEIDPCSVEYGGSWQGERLPDGTPTAWDGDLLRFFYRKLYFHSPPFFFDIGASFGSFCLLSKFLKDSRCYAFEPCSKVRKILERNIALNSLSEQVLIWDKALSDKRGPATLQIPGNSALGMACLSDDPQRFTMAGFETVTCCLLDDIVLPQRLTHIKMDVEGHELMVLRGGEKTIRRWMPDMLLEYDERNTAQFGYDRKEIVKLLQAWGYHTFEFLGPDGRDLWTTP